MKKVWFRELTELSKKVLIVYLRFSIFFSKALRFIVLYHPWKSQVRTPYIFKVMAKKVNFVQIRAQIKFCLCAQPLGPPPHTPIRSVDPVRNSPHFWILLGTSSEPKKQRMYFTSYDILSRKKVICSIFSTAFKIHLYIAYDIEYNHSENIIHSFRRRVLPRTSTGFIDKVNN